MFRMPVEKYRPPIHLLTCLTAGGPQEPLITHPSVDNPAKNPGIKGDDIMIVLHEAPLENWGIRGGRPASEVDLGFKIEI